MNVATTVRLRLRDIRYGTSLVIMDSGEQVELLTREDVALARMQQARATGNWNIWVEVKRSDGLEGVCSALYLKQAFAEFDKTLIGLHGPADPAQWPWLDGGFDVVRTSNVEAVKLLTPGHDSYVYGTVKNIDGVEFTMARLFAKFETPKSPAQFVEEVGAGMGDLYRNGMRYFEIHNEPNLHVSGSNPEGMWVNWSNGKEFSRWFIEVYERLKSLYPQAKLGFPGLSPGYDIYLVRYDSHRFLQEASEAIDLADWIGMHTYWNKWMSPENALVDIRDFSSKYPNKEIMVTEVSNSDRDVSSDTKGHQYVWLSRQTFPKNVRAIFFYILSASVDTRNESWKGTRIPEIISTR